MDTAMGLGMGIQMQIETEMLPSRAQNALANESLSAKYASYFLFFSFMFLFLCEISWIMLFIVHKGLTIRQLGTDFAQIYIFI